MRSLKNNFLFFIKINQNCYLIPFFFIIRGTFQNKCNLPSLDCSELFVNIVEKKEKNIQTYFSFSSQMF
jgi:hypothetical protein